MWGLLGGRVASPVAMECSVVLLWWSNPAGILASRSNPQVQAFRAYHLQMTSKRVWASPTTPKSNGQACTCKDISLSCWHKQQCHLGNRLQTHSWNLWAHAVWQGPASMYNTGSAAIGGSHRLASCREHARCACSCLAFTIKT